MATDEHCRLLNQQNTPETELSSGWLGSLAKTFSFRKLAVEFVEQVNYLYFGKLNFLIAVSNVMDREYILGPNRFFMVHFIKSGGVLNHRSMPGIIPSPAQV
jgi:hypothetical protein